MLHVCKEQIKVLCSQVFIKAHVSLLKMNKIVESYMTSDVTYQILKDKLLVFFSYLYKVHCLTVCQAYNMNKQITKSYGLKYHQLYINKSVLTVIIINRN